MELAGYSKIRLAVFLLIFSFMALGPFYRQILGGKNNLFRPWVMFKGKGVGIVDATFYQVLPDGKTIQINRYEVLGFKDPGAAPKKLKRIVGRPGTLVVVKALCEKLGDGADVRVRSRWASRKGWKPGFRGETNLCPQLTKRHKTQKRWP
jgi:hypothetical protein